MTSDKWKETVENANKGIYPEISEKEQEHRRQIREKFASNSEYTSRYMRGPLPTAYDQDITTMTHAQLGIIRGRNEPWT